MQPELPVSCLVTGVATSFWGLHFVRYITPKNEMYWTEIGWSRRPRNRSSSAHPLIRKVEMQFLLHSIAEMWECALLQLGEWWIQGFRWALEFGTIWKYTQALHWKTYWQNVTLCTKIMLNWTLRLTRSCFDLLWIETVRVSFRVAKVTFWLNCCRCCHWVRMCYPSTSCSRHASTSGRSCITAPSRRSGTGSSSSSSCTPPSSLPTWPPSCSTSRTSAIGRAKNTATIPSSL